MEITEIPEAFQSKLRLTIISALMKESCSFTELRRITGATDGNLSVQITNLESLGYITAKKEFIGKKPLTTCTLTDPGRESFVEYVSLLNRIVSGAE